MQAINASRQQRQEARLLVGDWHVLPMQNRLECGTSSVQLQRLSMEVLQFLAARPGQVVSYDELLAALWPGRFAGEDAVHRRIADLRSKLEDNAKAPRYIETIPKRGYRLIAPVVQATASYTPRPRRYGPIVLGASVAALGLAMLVTMYPRDVLLDSGSGMATEHSEPLVIDVNTSPAGAEVLLRPYTDPGTDWQALGVTPVHETLPSGTWVLRFVADGRETVERVVSNPGIELNNVGSPVYTITLPEVGSVPDDMVYVPDVDQPVPLWGFTQLREIGEYYIGRTEVSNAEFAVFVAMDGYQNRSYWKDLLTGVDAFPFEQVAQRFTDSTGKPGPAGWENGMYRAGTENLPVTGVSWYEAMAYARFRGVTLPTAAQWARAALGIAELDRPFAAELLAVSNLNAPGLVPASDARAMSTFGAVNLVGNAQEWTLSHSGNRRLTLGASFRGQPWAYAMPSMADSLNRLPTQGFRLASYDEEAIQSPMRPIALDGLLPEPPAISDNQYASMLGDLRYVPGSLDPSSVEVLAETADGGWTRRKILIPASDAAEPLPVVIFVSDGAQRPLQSLLYLSPGTRASGGLPSNRTDIRRYQIDFLIESGRAIVWPILAGTHERFTGKIQAAESREEAQSLRRAEILINREEIGRVVDYLVSAPEFDADAIGLLAASSGATVMAPQILAAEDRIRAAVFLSGGLLAVAPDRMPVFLNPNSYWPRVKVPIFFANGRYDVRLRFAPPKSIGGTLYEIIGTPEANKRLEIYEMAHWPFPALLLSEDLLPWLDEFLAP